MRAVLGAALAVAVALGAGPAALASPGQPDTLFATTPTPVGDAHAYPKALVVQPDGAIVTSVDAYDARKRRSMLALVRHTPAGVVERIVTTSLSDPKQAALTVDGSILVAGGDELARFSPELVLERVVEAPGVQALAVAPDGSVVTAATASDGDGALMVRRYTSALRSGSTARSALPGYVLSAAGIAVDQSGHVVLGGTAFAAGGTTEPFTARLPGAPKIVRSGLRAFQARAFALTAGGAPAVVGSGRDPLRSVLALARPGRPLTTIPRPGADGFATAAAVDRDGQIVVGGAVASAYSIETALVRLTPAGGLDPAFTPPTWPAPAGAPSAIAVDPRGGIVVATSAFVNGRQQLVLARYAGGAAAPLPPGIPAAPEP